MHCVICDIQSQKKISVIVLQEEWNKEFSTKISVCHYSVNVAVWKLSLADNLTTSFWGSLCFQMLEKFS